MNERDVAAWSATAIAIVLVTTNPVYKGLVLVAALSAVAAGAGLRRIRGLVVGVLLVGLFAALLNFISAHLGSTVRFALPDQVPALGGPYTLEALAFGATGGATIAAVILAAAPFSLLLASHEVIDALPAALSRTGAAIAASINLVPSVAASFTEVTEAQRLRGWRPRGPRSWAEIVVPVVLTTVEASIQLAESMEARGYGSGRRTGAPSGRMMGRDWLIAGASAVALAAFVGSRAAGWAADWYPYPSLAWPGIDLRPAAACLLLFTPVLVWRSRA